MEMKLLLCHFLVSKVYSLQKISFDFYMLESSNVLSNFECAKRWTLLMEFDKIFENTDN